MVTIPECNEEESSQSDTLHLRCLKDMGWMALDEDLRFKLSQTPIKAPKCASNLYRLLQKVKKGKGKTKKWPVRDWNSQPSEDAKLAEAKCLRWLDWSILFNSCRIWGADFEKERLVRSGNRLVVSVERGTGQSEAPWHQTQARHRSLSEGLLGSIGA
ncbi:hypothetical protein BC629DRAFT_1628287 [Irpex lacteus]|nr:hypothetical protein BC629DRAFT_1628287 [Irpex lacteus]